MIVEEAYEVDTNLVEKVVDSELLREAWRLVEEDDEVQAYLEQANVISVSRLKYNDHGPVHSRIVAGSALALLRIALKRGFVPSVVRSGAGDVNDAKVVTMLIAYLHDIGNSIHRTYHPTFSVLVSDKLLDRLLPKLYEVTRKAFKLKQEILHGVFCHDEAYTCLSIEAALAKIADGTDMAEGRARVPYKTGKVDIHSISALSIKRVWLSSGGNERPIMINVDMTNSAGIFQVQEVLGKKIATSGLAHYVEVKLYLNGEYWRSLTFETTHTIPVK